MKDISNTMLLFSLLVLCHFCSFLNSMNCSVLITFGQCTNLSKLGLVWPDYLTKKKPSVSLTCSQCTNSLNISCSSIHNLFPYYRFSKQLSFFMAMAIWKLCQIRFVLSVCIFNMAVSFQLFPKTFNLPIKKKAGYRLTFMQSPDISLSGINVISLEFKVAASGRETMLRQNVVDWLNSLVRTG